MESAEEIERQIWAQVEKFNEIDRQLKIFEQSATYKTWLKSPSDKLEVRLVLWPNRPNKTTFLQTLGKVPGIPAWAYDNEEKFLKRKGTHKRRS